VEKSQEPGPEAKPQRLRSLRLENQGGVIELQFVERFAQVAVIIGIHGIDPGKDHRLGMAIPGQRLRGCCSGWVSNGITHPAFVDRLEPGRDVPTSPADRLLTGFITGEKMPISTGFMSTLVAIMRSVSPALISPSITRM
jgi:hypothetical protein